MVPQGGSDHETTAPHEQAAQPEELPQGHPRQAEEPQSATHAGRLATIGPTLGRPVPCTRPLTAYRAPGGQVSFDRKIGWLDRPLFLACGQCFDCRRRIALEWTIRVMHERSLHKRASFLTLTYDEEHLPDDGGLSLDDWQRFAKRLRKAIGPFRFLQCGEYGDLSNRPHHHVALFGHDFSQDRILLSGQGNRRLYRSPLLEATWQAGECRIGSLTWQSAGYIARYVMKKLTGNEGVEEYGDLRPPFRTSSNRPGLAADWFKKWSRDVYPLDEVVINGKKYRPPKYYDKLFSDYAEEAMAEIKAKRAKLAARRQEKLTPQRLRDLKTSAQLAIRERQGML